MIWDIENDNITEFALIKDKKSFKIYTLIQYQIF
jgi:hypothetical protein